MGEILQLAAEILESPTMLQIHEPESHAAVFESQIKERSCLHRTVLTDANALKTSKDLETHLKAWPCPACTVEPFVSTAVVTLPVPIPSTVKLQADKDEQYSAN